MDHPANPLLTQHLIRRLLFNSALTVLSRAAAILVILLLVPVIIASLGPSGYGVWESLMAIAASSMIFHLVINSTVMWRISMSFGSGNRDEAQRMVRIGIGATLALIAVILPPIWLAGQPIVAALQIPAHWSDECRWLLPLLVAILLLGGINQALLAVVIGFQRAGVAAVVQSVGLVATHVTAIAALLTGYGLDALLLGYLTGSVVMFAIVYPLACSLCGRISLVPLCPTRHELCLLTPFAGLLLLSQLTLLFRDHADKLVLASLVSPATTGYFGLAQRLASIVMQVCVVICTPFTAAIGELFAREDWSSICILYQRATGWIGALAGLMTVLLCVLRRPIFVLWVGENVPQANAYLSLLLLGTTSAIIFAGAGVALAKGVGRPGLETSYTLVTLLLVVLTKPLFIVAFGPVGAVASSAISWCVGAICFLFLMYYHLKLPRRVAWQSAAIFAITIVACAIGSWAGEYFFDAIDDRRNAAIVLLLAAPPLAVGYVGILTGLRLIDLPLARQTALQTFPIHTLRRSVDEFASTDVAA